MAGIIIDPEDVNRELDKAGISQDLEFGGQNTLLKKDKLGVLGDTRPRLRYWKAAIDGQLYYGYLSPGEELKGTVREHGQYIGPDEYIELKYIEAYGDKEGREKWAERKAKYKLGGADRAIKMEELGLIRNDKEIENKILGK